jgi:hypothetical protein
MNVEDLAEKMENLMDDFFIDQMPLKAFLIR